MPSGHNRFSMASLRGWVDGITNGAHSYFWRLQIWLSRIPSPEFFQSHSCQRPAFQSISSERGACLHPSADLRAEDKRRVEVNDGQNFFIAAMMIKTAECSLLA